MVEFVLGTLLNKRYVMTAMHCVKDGNNLATQIDVSNTKTHGFFKAKINN